MLCLGLGGAVWRELKWALRARPTLNANAYLAAFFLREALRFFFGAAFFAIFFMPFLAEDFLAFLRGFAAFFFAFAMT